MSKYKMQKGLKTVKGVLLVPYESPDNESDYSDEDNEDLNDMFSYFGDLNDFVSTRRPKENKVDIKSHDGKIHPCSGRFPLTQTFWEVEVTMANGWLKQAPKYFILNDPVKCRISNMVNIFISDCVMREKRARPQELEVKACFEAYCRSSGKQETLNFQNLETIFRDFLMQEKSGCCLDKCKGGGSEHRTVKDHSSYMMRYVIGSELGAVVLLAVSHPQMVSTLSELLPYSFTQFLHKLRASSIFKSMARPPSAKEEFQVVVKKAVFMSATQVDQKVKAADEMARERPWEFAFKDIIGHNLGIYGTEARLQSYKQAGYLPRIPQKETDAMHIYEVLKEDARMYGNVYVELDRLKQSSIMGRLNHAIVGEKRWKDALDYLEANNVIKIEVFNYKKNIFLRSNWQAEVGTVNAMHTILDRHKIEPLQWSIDLTSPDFKHLHQDKNQRRATQLICQMPILVLSGKGGCGKTTVITKLLKHLCEREEIRLKEEEDEIKLCELLNEPFEDFQPGDSTTDKACPNNLPQKESSCAANEKKPQTGGPEESVAAYGGEVPRDVSTAEKLRRQAVTDLITILEHSKNEDSQALKDFKKKFLLTAPTGKAARLLGRKAKLPSATLHSVSMSWRNFCKRNSSEESSEDKTWIYENVQVLVVDECSLMSVRLFATVVSILLQKANLQKIVLLGDIRQLPSIEPGKFLKDIFNSFHNVDGHGFGFSMELTQNHRSESELIVENASRISNRQMPTFDPDGRFVLQEISDTRDDNERDNAIRQLLNDFEDLKSDVDSQFVAFRNAHCQAVNELCCQFYNRHSIAASSHGKRIKLDFQVGDKVCLGKNNLVLNATNLLLQRYLGDHRDLREALDRAMKRITTTKCQSTRQNLKKTSLNEQSALDLITLDEEVYNRTIEEMRLNDRQAEEQIEMERKRQPEKSGEKVEKPRRPLAESLIGEGTEKLCNGEVFFIMDELENIEEDLVVKYLILSDRDRDLPRVVCAPLRQLRHACKMKHSWARTIHTYQGSESDTVVYILGTAIPQNWQHVYTAITRGKKSVCIVGSHSQLLVAINRKEPKRLTRLAHRLKEMIAKNPDLMKRSKEDFMNISNPVPADGSLSDLSESFIHELDETVANFSAKCSSDNGRRSSDYKDKFSKLPSPCYEVKVDAAENNALKPSHADSFGAGVDTRHSCRDSDLFSLSSWDGEGSESLDAALTQPTQNPVLLHSVSPEQTLITGGLDSDLDENGATSFQPTDKPFQQVNESCGSCSDDSDLDERYSLLQTKRRHGFKGTKSLITSIIYSHHDDNKEIFSHPTHSSFPEAKVEESSSSSSCSDDSDLGDQHRPFQRKRLLYGSQASSSKGALASPPAPATSQNSNTGNVTPPDQKGPNLLSSDVSPSKRLRRNILSTPFQENFKHSLDLDKEGVKGGVSKKLWNSSP